MTKSRYKVIESELKKRKDYAKRALLELGKQEFVLDVAPFNRRERHNLRITCNRIFRNMNKWGQVKYNEKEETLTVRVLGNRDESERPKRESRLQPRVLPYHEEIIGNLEAGMNSFSIKLPDFAINSIRYRELLRKYGRHWGAMNGLKVRTKWNSNEGTLDFWIVCAECEQKRQWVVDGKSLCELHYSIWARTASAEELNLATIIACL